MSFLITFWKSIGVGITPVWDDSLDQDFKIPVILTQGISARSSAGMSMGMTQKQIFGTYTIHAVSISLLGGHDKDEIAAILNTAGFQR